MKLKATTLFIVIILVYLCYFSNSYTLGKSKIKKTNLQTQNPEDDIKKILKDDYETFIKNLGDNIKDPKFREAIRSLSTKDKVISKEISVPVKNLIPTQNEIDVDKSLKFTLTDPVSTSTYMGCKEPIKISGKMIVTSAGGKYVIDGHHRWSQVYAINPNCTMAAIDLSDIVDPINALKSTQLAIAASKSADGKEITTIPVSIVQGKNLLKITMDDLFNYVKTNLAPKVLEVFKSYNLKTNDDVANYIWKNVEEMQNNNQPIKGAPSRGVMPQTDIAANWLNNTVNTDVVIDSKYIR